jgi:signal peptidase I
MVAMVVGTFRSAVADWNDVPTGSMRPTILEGDRIFVNKLAYDLKVPFTTWHFLDWSEPSRGDIVVFFSPEDGKRLVKRVVGLPGDQLAMRHGQLWLNEEKIDYERLEVVPEELPEYELEPRHLLANEDLEGREHSIVLAPGRPSVRFFGPVEVPDGHFFMMGDNRDNSRDSRWFGFVPRQQILGRAVAVAASVDPERWYLPRWNRFLLRLL